MTILTEAKEVLDPLCHTSPDEFRRIIKELIGEQDFVITAVDVVTIEDHNDWHQACCALQRLVERRMGKDWEFLESRKPDLKYKGLSILGGNVDFPYLNMPHEVSDDSRYKQGVPWDLQTR